MSLPVITQMYSYLHIPASNVEAAHRAVLAVSPGCQGDTFDQSCLHGWWGFQTTTEPNGDISGILFVREHEEDMGTLFNALAPFVETPGILDFQDNLGNRWRWVLKDGKATKWPGRVVHSGSDKITLYSDPNPNGQL